ncbi:MAG: DUF4350 domain-containing protein [Thermoanaerobaculia bacterium]
MKRSPWPWLAALGLAAAILVLLAGRGFGASSSALSRDASGWLAARRYLEARGADVHLLDRALSDSPSGGVLVLAFPWQQAVTEDEIHALGDHLRAGNTVVLAYSGEPLELREARVLEALALEASDIRSRPPLNPFRWWSYHRESWLLEASFEPGSPIRVPAFRRAPTAPESADVLYRDGEDRPLVFAYPLHRGKVVVLPAGVLSNAWIAAAGNADFLESLLDWLGEDWIFDEVHHGLVAADAAAASPTKFAWDLFIAHLALIYVLGVVSLGRPFGPAWRERPAAAGSTASFLRQLGALHHQLGHHGQASALLVERAKALDPDLPIAEDLPPGGDTRREKKRLLETARRIYHAQRRTSP